MNEEKNNSQAGFWTSLDLENVSIMDVKRNKELNYGHNLKQIDDMGQLDIGIALIGIDNKERLTFTLLSH